MAVLTVVTAGASVARAETPTLAEATPTVLEIFTSLERANLSVPKIDYRKLERAVAVPVTVEGFDYKIQKDTPMADAAAAAECAKKLAKPVTDAKVLGPCWQRSTNAHSHGIPLGPEEIEAVDLAKLPASLVPSKAKLEKLAKDHLLVMATIPADNEERSHVVFAFRKTKSGPRITALFAGAWE